jgi:predicted nucleic acid-binding protein
MIGELIETIAAIALCRDREIVTRDEQFLRVPNLKVLKY